uniref:RING-CH-type domain-containing protein n=1 Tax=Strongyloides venezuelensis TaxID=75913 RepID=A0A0K0FLZ2_STRVS
MKSHSLDRLNSSAPPYVDLTKEKRYGKKDNPEKYFLNEGKEQILEGNEKSSNGCTNDKIIQRHMNNCNNGICNDLLEDNDEMCRICHSETGILISPCICQGSMGFIHDNCLTEWIKTSGKRICELCGTKYEAKKEIVWNVMAWSKPYIGGIEYFKVILLSQNILLLQNSLLILIDRKFIKRIFKEKLLPRYHDVPPIRM